MIKGIISAWITVLIIFSIGIIEMVLDHFRPKSEWTLRIVFTVVLASAIWLGIGKVYGMDRDGRYAQSPLHPWFDQLKSGKGLCCSLADGNVVEDPDWESDRGHFRVRIEGQWIDVPDDAVITEPNRAGRTMVWPMRGPKGVDIRCFMAGPMS